MNYLVLNETSLPLEYCELRKLADMSNKTIEAAMLGLPKSLFAVIIRDKNSNQLIGMGRIIGDLGCHVQICDVVIHPEFQRKGLSRIIMNEIMKFIHHNVPECAFVNLFADIDYLYQKFGFIKSSESVGMYLDRSKG